MTQRENQNSYYVAYNPVGFIHPDDIQYHLHILPSGKVVVWDMYDKDTLPTMLYIANTPEEIRQSVTKKGMVPFEIIRYEKGPGPVAPQDRKEVLLKWYGPKKAAPYIAKLDAPEVK